MVRSQVCEEALTDESEWKDEAEHRNTGGGRLDLRPLLSNGTKINSEPALSTSNPAWECPRMSAAKLWHLPADIRAQHALKHTHMHTHVQPMNTIL
jgi:hypothetical protein